MRSLVGLVVILLLSGAVSAAEKLHHRVKKGDTLYAIARHYGVTVRELAAANKIKNTARLKVGRRLVIPGDGEPDEFDQNESTAGPLEVIPDPMLPPLLAPVDGPVISPFAVPRGNRVHKGIDIKAPEGTPIRASADGIVRVSSERFGQYGRLVVIEHPGGVATYYGHNEKNLVAAGQVVLAGDVIALVGRSGNASCDHLHFEVRVKGAPVNPEKVVQSAPVAEAIPTQPAAGQR